MQVSSTSQGPRVDPAFAQTQFDGSDVEPPFKPNKPNHYKHTDFLEMRHSLSLRTVMLTSHFDLGVKWWEDVFTAPDFRRPCWAGMDEPHLPATLWTSACPKPTAVAAKPGAASSVTNSIEPRSGTITSRRKLGCIKPPAPEGEKGDASESVLYEKCCCS